VERRRKQVAKAGTQEMGDWTLVEHVGPHLDYRGVKLQVTLGRAFIVGFGFMLGVMAAGGLPALVIVLLAAAAAGGE
jgi:hypothetical protein